MFTPQNRESINDAALDRFRVRLVQSVCCRPTTFALQNEDAFPAPGAAQEIGHDDWIDGEVQVAGTVKLGLDCLRGLFKLLIYDYNDHWTSKMRVNRMLHLCLQMTKGEAASFKLLVASACCARPRPILAHGTWLLAKHRDGEGAKHAMLTQLMAIIFDSLSLHRDLVELGSCNIYRTAFMMQSDSAVVDVGATRAAYFTAVLQITMIIYVFVHTWQEFGEEGLRWSDVSWEKVPLAVLLVAYSLMVETASVDSIRRMCRLRFWTRAHPAADEGLERQGRGRSAGASVWWMVGAPPLRSGWVNCSFYVLDLTCNGVFPFLLVLIGFFLIIFSETLMDAVLNSAALLFIPEIDDQIPGLLGIPTDDVAMKYVTSTILPDLAAYVRDRRARLLSGGSSLAAPPSNHVPRDDSSSGRADALHDVLLATNPAAPHIGEALPRQIRPGMGEIGVDISAVAYVTADCLFRRMDALRVSVASTSDSRHGSIVWVRLWPMREGGAPLTFGSHSRFGDYVQLQTLERGCTAERDQSFWPQPLHAPQDRREDGADQCFERITLEGAMIVTDIAASATIVQLRVCHAYSGPQLADALEYYDLFDCDGSAADLLRADRPAAQGSVGHAAEEGDGAASSTSPSRSDGVTAGELRQALAQRLELC